MKGRAVGGRILQAGTMNAHNTFDQPNGVAPKPFTGAQLVDDGLNITLPAMAVVALEVR